MIVREVRFVSPGTVALEERELTEPGPGEVRVAMELTAISAGTERDFLLGRNNTSQAYPMTLGYSGYGRVSMLGADVTGLAVGDRVATLWSTHASACNVRSTHALKVGEHTSDVTAAIALISSFALAALRKTKLEIGQPVLVAGLGILGLLTAQLAMAAGAVPVIGADPNPSRTAFAMQLGVVDATVADLTGSGADLIRSLVPSGVPVAVDATGAAAALPQILEVCAKLGHVALLGCTRDPGPGLDFYRLVHTPGITLVGAHTTARPSQSSPGLWTEADDMRAVLALSDAGRLDLTKLVTDVHSPTDAPAVYQRILAGSSPAAALFDWRSHR